MPRPSTQTEYRLEIWQDGGQIDTVTGDDFAAVHQEAMRLALILGDDGHVEVRGVPADKWKELQAALGCLPQ